MSKNPLPPAQQLIHRLFWFQVIVTGVSSVVFIFAVMTELIGFFWFAFIAGSYGASISMLRRIQKQPDSVRQTIVDSWPLTLSPLLYGSMLAGLTYFFFASEILSGVGGEGLIKLNLFPDFGTDPNLVEGQVAKPSEFRSHSPASIRDAGKLLVWCFLAGYSEEFVTRILGSLEGQIGGKKQGLSQTSNSTTDQNADQATKSSVDTQASETSLVPGTSPKPQTSSTSQIWRRD